MIIIPGGGGGDITAVVAGDGLSGGGTSESATLNLDLNELTAAAVADGDFIPIIDTNDSNGSRKEAVHDLATLFSGDGLAATNSVMAVDLGTNPGLEFSSNKLQIAKGISQHDVAQFGSGVVDDDFLRVDGTTIEGRSASEVLSDIGGAALTGSTDNTVATVTGANALAGEANLTFDGSTLAVTGAVTVSTDLTVSGGDIVYGNGQNATASVTATAHDAAGRNLTITAGPTTAGTSNNQAGGALTLQGGQGKGSGAGGDIIFQTANASGSGSSLNSHATALTLSDDLSATFAGSITTGTTVISDDSVVMTPSTSDTVTVAAATNGVLNVTTVDNAAAAANLNFVIDGAVDIDAAGGINLDSGSGIWTFEDSGTEMLRFTEGNSGDVTIKLVTNAKDLIFTDNGDATGLTIKDAAAGIVVPGEVMTTKVSYTDGDDAMTVADGGGVTFAQDVTITDGKGIIIESEPADDAYTGIFGNFANATGSTITKGQIVYMTGTANQVAPARANAVGTMPAVAMAIADVANGATGNFLMYGFAHDASAFIALTIGGEAYVSDTAAGALDATAPADTGEFVQIIGVGMHGDKLFFNPQLPMVKVS